MALVEPELGRWLLDILMIGRRDANRVDLCAGLANSRFAPTGLTIDTRIQVHIYLGPNDTSNLWSNERGRKKEKPFKMVTPITN